MILFIYMLYTNITNIPKVLVKQVSVYERSVVVLKNGYINSFDKTHMHFIFKKVT